MKPIPLLLLVAALACASSPALACRIAPPPPSPETVEARREVMLIATVESRELLDEGTSISAVLKVETVFRGDAPDRIDAGGDFVIGCTVPYAFALAEVPVGGEVVVFGEQTGGGVNVWTLAAADSDQGRAMLALARTYASNE